MKYSKEMLKYMIEYPNTEGIERETVEQIEMELEEAIQYINRGRYREARLLLADSVKLMERLEK